MTENKLEYPAIDLITNGPKVPGACVMDATGVTWTATSSTERREEEKKTEKKKITLTRVKRYSHRRRISKRSTTRKSLEVFRFC